MSREEWRDVVGYVGWYKVSSHGRVKSLPRWIVRRKRANYRETPTPIFYSGKLLDLHKDRFGYIRVHLSKNGRGKLLLLHRVVAQAFLLAGAKDQTEVNHLDGDKENNKATNLAWVTPGENVRHARDIGLTHGLKGEAHPLAVLTEADVLTIRKMSSHGYTRVELSKRFGVTAVMISNIVLRKSWRHVI